MGPGLELQASVYSFGVIVDIVALLACVAYYIEKSSLHSICSIIYRYKQWGVYIYIYRYKQSDVATLLISQNRCHKINTVYT